MVEYPWWSDPGNLLCLFGLLLLGFHLVFLAILPIPQEWWRKTDYLWLLFASMGLLGAAGQARRVMAPPQVDSHQRWADEALTQLHSFAQLPYHCRRYNLSDTPLPDLIEMRLMQGRFCGWGAELRGLLPDTVSVAMTTARFPDLPSPPSERGQGFDWELEEFDRLASRLRSELESLGAAQALGRRTDAETTLLLLAPFFLALALALRITKVTAGCYGADERPRFRWAARLAERLRTRSRPADDSA